MTPLPKGFKAGDLEAHVSTGKLARLFKLLKQKYREDPDPDGKAKIDIAKLLGAAFDKMGKRFEDAKNVSLKRLVKLQMEALDFYNHALSSSDPPDVKKLERILKDMEKEFYQLAKKVTDHVDESQPLEPEVTFDPQTGRKVVKYGGGVEEGGATYIDEPGKPLESFATHEGSHPGRKKATLPVPEGMVKGEHIGHGHGEGSVRDPRVTNVLDNLESEAARSNLSPKKKLDNLVRKLADFYPNRVVTRVKRLKHAGDKRPYASSYEVALDGVVLYKLTIPNQ
jgi:hypothetical protein